MILFLDLWSYLLLSILVILLRSYQLSCCFSNMSYFTLCIALVLCPLPRMFLSWTPTRFASSFHSVSKNIASLKNSPYSVPTQQFSELSVGVYQGLLLPLLCYILLLLLITILIICIISLPCHKVYKLGTFVCVIHSCIPSAWLIVDTIPEVHQGRVLEIIEILFASLI